MSTLDAVGISYVVVIAWNVVVGWTLVMLDVIFLYRDWDAVYIVKRKRINLALIVAILGFIEFIYMPVATLYLAELVVDSTFEWVALLIYQWLGLPSLILFCWLLLIKFWIFYFDSKRLWFETNKTWRLAIDPVHESSNFFVNKSLTYGSSKYLLRYVAVLTVVQVALFRIASEVIHKFVPWIGLFVFTVYIVVWVVLAFVVFKKLHMETNDIDILGMRKELMYIAMLAVIASVTIFGVAMSQLIAPVDGRIVWLFGTFLYFTTMHILLFLIVLYPRRLYNNLQNQKDALLDVNGIHAWHTFVTSFQGFQAFMLHLESEFSLECGLYCQEIVQVKHVLVEQFEEAMELAGDGIKKKRFDLELPDSVGKGKLDGSPGRHNDSMSSMATEECIPESMIAQRLRKSIVGLHNQGRNNDKDDLNTVRGGTESSQNTGKNFDVVSVKKCEKVIEAFESIFKKYIDPKSAILEVNISGNCRDQLVTLLDPEYCQRQHLKDLKDLKRDSRPAGTTGSAAPNLALVPQDSESTKKLQSGKDTVGMSAGGLKDLVFQKRTCLREKLANFVLDALDRQLELSENNLLKFVLVEILPGIEASAWEVSRLCQSSFTRFRAALEKAACLEEVIPVKT